ncbi:uncharacterized protein LOC131162364 [Malania oleifera]|uniref:uncharacterized protein LOC131162364 n=1 Tax=Malania oleifera TaxID=397392 RepID=UPI0025AE067C|nr:uncharacterized protein LOC131162364 [Malania oleifera]
MDPGGSIAHASGDDGTWPSSIGGGDSNVVLCSLARQVIDEIVRSSREHGGPSATQSCTIKKFTKMNPPKFSGAADPTVAENWIQEIDKVLMVLHCTDEQKVLYATCNLIGEAKRWWTTTRLLEEHKSIPVPLTWSRLRKIFFDRYFPTTIRVAKVHEFLSLTQGPLIAQQYAAKFIELSRFDPYVVPDEAKKSRMFERGLRQDIYKQVAVLKMQNFSKLVERAIVAEENEQKDVGVPSQRKRTMPPGFQTGSSRGPWREDRYRGG